MIRAPESGADSARRWALDGRARAVGLVAGIVVVVLVLVAVLTALLARPRL